MIGQAVSTGRDELSAYALSHPQLPRTVNAPLLPRSPKGFGRGDRGKGETGCWEQSKGAGQNHIAANQESSGLSLLNLAEFFFNTLLLSYFSHHAAVGHDSAMIVSHSCSCLQNNHLLSVFPF